MSAVMFPKSVIIRSKRIRESARGKDCTVRGPLCNYDPATTVCAHSPFRAAGGGGMGFKVSDFYSVRACSACHDWLDGRVQYDGPCESRTVSYHRAQDRTHQQWIEESIITVKT